MTSIARRVEEDIQRISERMGLPSQRASEPSQQPARQQGSEPLGTPSTTGAAAMAAAVALAAAAAAACSDNADPLRLAVGGQTSAGETAAAAAAASGGAAMPQAAPASAVAATAAAAAARGASGSGPGQEMPEYGLDLQLLRQLAADSGSQTSRSDDPSAAQDTCASRQQQEQPCSQQANLQQPVAVADEDHLEVQSALKRRRLNPAEQPAASPAAAGNAGARSPAAAEAAAAAATQQPGASPGVQQGAGQQQRRQAGAERSPEAADADVPVVLTHMCPSSAEHRVSCSGTSPPRQQSPGCGEQLQLQQEGQNVASGAGVGSGAAAAADAAGVAAAAGQQEQHGMHAFVEGDGHDGDDSGTAGGTCAREASIMRQTQVALTTWRHLQSTASTPSTVMQGTGQPNCNATETALTASSAVQ